MTLKLSKVSRASSLLTLSLAALVVLLLLPGIVLAGRASGAVRTALPRPTARAISPAGTMVAAGDFPAAAVLSPAGILYVVDAGEMPNQLNSFDTAAAMAATTVLPTGPIQTNAAPYAQSGGIALSSDGKTLYTGGGRLGIIRAYSASAVPAMTATYTIGPSSTYDNFVAGIAVSHDGRYLYAALPFKDGAIDRKGRAIARVDTRDSSIVMATVGLQPLQVVDGFIRRGHREVVAVANRDDGTVSILDARTLAAVATVATGRQPAAMTFVDGGTHLLVVDTLDDELVDIQTATWHVVGRVALYAPGPLGPGAAPSALAVSRNGRTVYVALSADNALAVVQRTPGTGRSASRPGTMILTGRIPTATYPTAVVLDEAKGMLYVTCGKGVDGPTPGPPAGTPVLQVSQPNMGSSGLGVAGVVENIPLVTARADLSTYSAMVATNNNWSVGVVSATIPATVTHVVYIIRENKTYDEEFGDLAGGDPTNCMYCQVTPNAHALASRFALLEAFYANEEVSDTGHQVVMGGVANDFVERFTQQSYNLDGAPRPGSELGNNADTLWAPGDYLLDDALVHGISFRDYGEFYRVNQKVDGPAVTPALDAHIVHAFPGFGFDPNTPDTKRVAYWNKDFQSDVANNTFPSLEVIYLPEDHTTSSVNPLPQQQVADSDLATGRIVDAISHSRYWGSTAIFLTEDDPQSGIDHIDEHRTIGLVISPWVKAGNVTARYDQDGMLRTVERTLGLPPMTEFDATAPPMDALFNQKTPDLTPYDVVTPTVPLPSGAAQAAVKKLALTLLGAHPSPGQITPNAQLQIQWLATHGTPFKAPAWLARRKRIWTAKTRQYLWSAPRIDTASPAVRLGEPVSGSPARYKV